MTKSLKEEQDVWYKKLKDDGFEDIEESFQFHSHHFKRQTIRASNLTETYYDKAKDFLSIYEFDTETEKQLWSMHTQGNTVREIAQYLSLSRGTTHRRIVQLRKIMLEGML